MRSWFASSAAPRRSRRRATARSSKGITVAIAQENTLRAVNFLPIGAHLEPQPDQQDGGDCADCEKQSKWSVANLLRCRLRAGRNRCKHGLGDHRADGEECEQEPIDQQRGNSSHSPWAQEAPVEFRFKRVTQADVNCKRGS